MPFVAASLARLPSAWSCWQDLCKVSRNDASAVAGIREADFWMRDL